jgi:hypothetical protein
MRILQLEFSMSPVAGRVSRCQQQVIEYLADENRAWNRPPAIPLPQRRHPPYPSTRRVWESVAVRSNFLILREMSEGPV